MTEKREMVREIKELLKQAIEDFAVANGKTFARQVPLLAVELGVSPKSIYAWTNLRDLNSPPPIHKLVEISLLLKDMRVFDRVERWLGRVAWAPCVIHGRFEEINRLTADAVQEFGEVLSSAAEAMRNGLIDREEAASFEKEAFDVIRVLRECIAAVWTAAGVAEAV